MKAEPVADATYPLSENAYARLRVVRVPAKVPGSLHDFKYSLTLVVSGKRVVGYDNEAGKGDHRHVRGKESSYAFTTLEQLEVDFWNDVNKELDS